MKDELLNSISQRSQAPMNRAAYRQLISELEGQAATINAAAQARGGRLYADEGKALDAINARVTEAQRQLAAYERSTAANVEDMADNFRAANAADAAVAARRQARSDKINAETAALDAQIAGVHWDVQVPPRDQRIKRDVLREHLAELSQRKVVADKLTANEAVLDAVIADAVAGGKGDAKALKEKLLQHSSMAFTTIHTDKLTGKRYLIESNEGGETFVDNAVGMDSGG